MMLFITINAKNYQKYLDLKGFLLVFAVAPYAGAWIEININLVCNGSPNVAPYAGAWIEI
ncbi:hypothetical protein SBF1_4320013 [Candidatus Desulfosporosinus infrequens]|uniref:Uncharacterized protein n=1 Tax=Candidatus Desulfosporosinus infrequens TaxID=2043169 RepID=A0A2U3LB42_9FIRM|nr:hypothetical protein SBF1_4320013 [Candidatus Desulfosporosinus infrequens]